MKQKIINPKIIILTSNLQIISWLNNKLLNYIKSIYLKNKKDKVIYNKYNY